MVVKGSAPFCIALALLSACGTAKRGITDGRYMANGAPVQVQVLNDTIAVMPSDTSSARTAGYLLLPTAPNAQRPQRFVLQQTSFDVDVLTTLLKFRPAQGALPAQMETDLSGSLFFGRRTDRYVHTYPAGPFARSKRNERHQGISGGLLIGLGGAPINPWVTQNRVTAEYTGVVLGYGGAVIVAVDRTSVGVALGWDHLLDPNAALWSYEGHAWLGLIFGLNLN